MGTSNLSRNKGEIINAEDLMIMLTFNLTKSLGTKCVSRAKEIAPQMVKIIDEYATMFHPPEGEDFDDTMDAAKGWAERMVLVAAAVRTSKNDSPTTDQFKAVIDDLVEREANILVKHMGVIKRTLENVPQDASKEAKMLALSDVEYEFIRHATTAYAELLTTPR